MSSSSSEGAGKQASAAGARPAVLLVDDMQPNLTLLQALLADLDCELVLARSGTEALKQLLRREFAVVLLDVQMPEMDGYEVARIAHAHPTTKNVPVVFVTATSDDQHHILRGYSSGAVDFLLKPVNSTILRSKVRVFLDLYRRRRELADAKLAIEHTYEELRASQAQLVHSAKMASLGALVAGIAHEINNPLAFSLSHLETALRSLPPLETALTPSASSVASQWDKMKNRLGQMHLGLDRIRDLVVKLRIFSRLDADERGSVNVKDCVEAVLTILGHRLGEPIRVVREFHGPATIDCYPGLMNQALMNLIANAIDAVGNEGTIGIRTGVVGDRYVIAISDSGPGIPEPMRSRVFEPFFTTKPVGQGTGLGLSITHSIVEKHGGTLGVECPAGGGTTMTISLPFTGNHGGNGSEP